MARVFCCFYLNYVLATIRDRDLVRGLIQIIYISTNTINFDGTLDADNVTHSSWRNLKFVSKCEEQSTSIDLVVF